MVMVRSKAVLTEAVAVVVASVSAPQEGEELRLEAVVVRRARILAEEVVVLERMMVAEGAALAVRVPTMGEAVVHARLVRAEDGESGPIMLKAS